MRESPGHIVTSDEEIATILRQARRIAVLGIKPESRRGEPAHDVPAYLLRVGYDVIPVPVYYPDVTQILGRPVVRSLTAIEGTVDVLNIFRRPKDIEQHVEDILKLSPKVVWMQLGIRHDAVAERLVARGILVVQDRCIYVQHAALG